jgi:tetratricopeptide (TPR) repeat protein
MKTLYDLLGALPDDDAESLRTAFHKAVRASHPDINTDDPDAPSRFRKIVRANAILSDAQQRATYDRLVALALRQASAKSKRGIRSGSIRKLASDAMAVAFLSAVSIGGYIVFERLSMAPGVPAKMVEVTARGPAEVAAVAPTVQPNTGLRDELRETFERAGIANEAMAPDAVTPAANPASGQAVANVGAAPDLPANHANSYARYEPGDTPESAGVADEAIAPSAVAAAPNTNSAQAVANVAPVPDAPSAAAPAADTGSAQANAVRAPDLTVNDAKSYRERGIFAYRDGDLYRAIADFDLAIQHDPRFAEAYIDRGIVFYRMHEFDRAFADIAQAKRIESANRTKTAPRKDERSYRSGRLREVRS